jgi:phosphatidylglycerol:prolipoprotein diacylglycerol transferase
VAGPLIPYVTLPEIPLSFLLHVPLIGGLFNPAHPPSIKPFGALVATGVWIGSVVAMNHARERRVDEKKMNEFIFWVVAAGFIGGHMLDAIFYHPDQIARDPLYLFRLWDGLSSFGGFTGALIGAVLYRQLKKDEILRYCEMVCSAFPLAWVFGRAGCASVHDHPGNLSDAWFAVRYPFQGGVVGRYDLGLYEMVLTIPLALLYLWLWRRRRWGDGFFIGLMCVAYAPIRFFLDFLRVPEGSMSGADPRYGGLTPAQWACFGLLALGVYFLRLSKKNEATMNDEPEPAAEDDDDEAAEPAPPPRPRRRRAKAAPEA